MYHLKYGDLILYGENLKTCTPYIDNVIECVEDIFDYCSAHDIRIFYNITHSIVYGLIEYFRVKVFIKRYSVRGSWKDFARYCESTGEF